MGPGYHFPGQKFDWWRPAVGWGEGPWALVTKRQPKGCELGKKCDILEIRRICLFDHHQY